MADFTGTTGNNDWRATSGSDNFYFGENEGVDLILDFDLSSDTLVYTDNSVDGFDDLEITRLRTSDGVVSTVIESNDQYTILYGIDPFSLTDRAFAFTDDGDRGTLEDARDPDDIDDLPDEVQPAAIDARVDALEGNTADEPGLQIGEDRFVTAESFVDGNGDSELLARIYDGDGQQVRSFYVRSDSELNYDPVLAAREGGGFAVAWVNQDDDDPEEALVYLRTYDENGGAIGGLNTIATGADRIDEPALTALEGGGFAVAFENEAAGSVEVQRISNDGRDIGDRITVDTGVDLSGSPAIEALDGGGFRVTLEKGGETRSYDFDGNDTTGQSTAPPDTTPDDSFTFDDGIEDMAVNNDQTDDDMLLLAATDDAADAPLVEGDRIDMAPGIDADPTMPPNEDRRLPDADDFLFG